MRRVHWILAGVTVPLLQGWMAAGEPPRLTLEQPIAVQTSQHMADELAAVYKTSGRMKNYDVSIDVDGGVVTLSGTVTTEEQRATLLNLTRRHPGVVAVNDSLTTRDIVPANYEPAPVSLPKPMIDTAPGGMPGPGPAPLTEPAPINAFPGGVSPYSDAPVLPPYSWPAYTPYNNYASMAYQTQYPGGAWPFIGPPHPYPMIPSGWRRVTLKWSKGYWWMKFHAF